MGEYGTFVAYLLILDGLDKSAEQDEGDARDDLLIGYDLDIAEEMYYKGRYQDVLVYHG